jgi:hypothetical protein
MSLTLVLMNPVELFGFDHRSIRVLRRAAIATGPLVRRLTSTVSAATVLRNSGSHRARTTCGIVSGGVVSMLEAMETHCLETPRQRAWICRSVSASFRGSARDFCRAIVLFLFPA